MKKSLKNNQPDFDEALRLIWPNLLRHYPNASKDQVQDHRSGVRLNTEDKLPLILRLSDKKWAFTALGSKGLLYHAHYAQKLTDEIKSFSNDKTSR